MKYIVLLFAAFPLLHGQQRVTYTISFENRVHHEAEITAAFSGVPFKTLEGRMSRSSPGRHALHEFAKNVYNVRAFDSKGNTLSIIRPNLHQWDIAHHVKTNALGLLGALTHEFIHSWNVERIRPKSLEPFNFEEANMSGELWFAEGITNYYQQLTLVRAQIVSIDKYSKNISGALSYVINGPGRQLSSAVNDTLEEHRQLEVVPYEHVSLPVTDAMSAFREQWLGTHAGKELPALTKTCSVCKRTYPFKLDYCQFDGDTLRIMPGK
ncbi:MAG TPA: hypothetical protein VGR15_04380 [Bacteroidota bacterium]|jgi:hypothetical protein|nr:hypothetical protein [Bacteroidota bacterium]